MSKLKERKAVLFESRRKRRCLLLSLEWSVCVKRLKVCTNIGFKFSGFFLHE